MRSLTRAVAALAVCMPLSLAACTSATATQPLSNGLAASDTIPPNSWLSVRPNDVLLIQYTRTEDNVQGTVDESYLKSDSLSVGSHHVAVRGVINETNLTLDIAGTPFSGSLSGSRLTLNLPDSVSGGIETVEMRPGSTAEYNAGVAALQATASANADAAAQAAASAEFRRGWYYSSDRELLLDPL